MTIPATSRSSKPPLGGIRPDWRSRLFRFHLAFALVSCLALVLSMTLPSFDVTAYPALDMHASSPFPEGRSEHGQTGMETDHGGDEAEPMTDEDHGGDHGKPADGNDHGEGHDGAAPAEPTEGHS